MLTSVVSYPDRGPWGDARFPGNFSGHLVMDLLDYFKPRYVIDPTRGSGTTLDVCRERGVRCWSEDIHTGFDGLSDCAPTGADAAIIHLPYGPMIRYPSAHPHELSRFAWEEFVPLANQFHYNVYSVLCSGGVMASLMGVMRKGGQIYDMSKELTWYGTPYASIIKLQHNMRSRRTNYYGRPFIATLHEVLVVTKKPNMYVVPMLGRAKVRFDQRRECRAMPWRAIVFACLDTLGGEAALRDIYDAAGTFVRVREAGEGGTDWQAIIRRELQQREEFVPCGRGRWALSGPE
jgi:hypothetical protein